MKICPFVSLFDPMSFYPMSFDPMAFDSRSFDSRSFVPGESGKSAAD